MSVSAPATAAAPAARVVGLVKTFGAVKALAGISAELPPGTILGLVGPDGAGKTTLIRLLAGLMQPTAGTVEVLGRTPEPSTTGGISDARFIRALCPVVELGLVGATMHAVDECVPVADLRGLQAVYERVIERYFETF